jgi:hypothetical protein
MKRIAILLTVLVAASSAAKSAHAAMVFNESDFGNFPTFFMTAQDIQDKIKRSNELLGALTKSKYSAPHVELSCRYNSIDVKCKKRAVDDNSGFYQLQQEIPFVPRLGDDADDINVGGSLRPPAKQKAYYSELEKISRANFPDELLCGETEELDNPYSYDNWLLMKVSREIWRRDFLAIWEKLATIEAAKDCKEKCASVIQVRHSAQKESIQYCTEIRSEEIDAPRHAESNQRWPSHCQVVVFKDGANIYALRAKFYYYCIDCAYDVPDFVAGLKNVDQASKNETPVTFVCPIERGHGMEKVQTLYAILNDEPFKLFPTVIKQQQSKDDTALISFSRGFQVSSLFSPQRELTEILATVSPAGDALQMIFVFNIQLGKNTADISNFSHASPVQRAEYIRQFVDVILKGTNCGVK